MNQVGILNGKRVIDFPYSIERDTGGALKVIMAHSDTYIIVASNDLRLAQYANGFWFSRRFNYPISTWQEAVLASLQEDALDGLIDPFRADVLCAIIRQTQEPK